MTFTERAGRLEAAELRSILTSHLRLSFTEKKGWFSILFTVQGEEPYISRCREEIKEWRFQQFMARAW